MYYTIINAMPLATQVCSRPPDLALTEAGFVYAMHTIEFITDLSFESAVFLLQDRNSPKLATGAEASTNITEKLWDDSQIN